MAKLTHAESRRLYSWWWDSHISPKNSKWLQENLTEMDVKVKAMIKLIEEDADSFARRAEMYYKKRPELMKLVEEFYRAYRALSERYDHATGALRQARRTIEEAFPSQIPFMPSDEPDSGPSSIGSASHAPPGPVFDADDSQKNHDVKKDGTESEKEATLLQHNQSLERISNMEAEISHYQQELKKLNDEMLISASNLKNAEERCILLDEANQSLQSELDALKQRANEQSVELKKKQEDLEKLKDMELSKMDVEEEIRQLKEENGSLNEQILESALKIISLQDEIILLKDMKAKLEDEVRFHEEEKVVLHQEISYLKEDKIELEKRDYQLMEQIEELKVTCKKHEDEKVFHLENLKLMENISEKNVVLENSLSGANVEIEGSREKINMLQDSCGSLNGTISVHLSEKASLVSQVEKLSDRSKFLENSLSDMNAELESLRVKSKNMEESCRSLFAQNYTLLSEKDTLVSQVERAIRSLETLEARYFELEHMHLNLENVKESALDEIMELEDSFKQEKGEYETLIMSIMLSSNSQVSSLENQIGFLHEEAQLAEEEFEAEQNNLMDAQIENFIFQNCLRDTNENCHRQLEAAKCSDKLISELRKELLVQGKILASSSELNEKLREGIRSILRELCVINKVFNSLNGVEDESILELTLREIKDLSNSISDTQNENQHLLLENSIILTILTQFGLQAMDPRMEKDALERGFKNKIQEFSVLQTAHSTLQSDVSKLLEENHSLSKNFYDLKERSDMLEEENRILLAELVTAEFLYLIFKNSSEEKASELQVSKNDLVHLHGVKNALDLEVGPAIEKLVSTMIENIHLKEMSANLQGSFEILENDLNMTRNICEQSKLEIESTKSLSSQNNIQLLQADQKLWSIKEESMEVRTRLEGLQLDLDKVMKVREELDNKIISFDDGNAIRDHQIMGLRQENEMIIKERDQFRQEIDGLKTREEHLIYDLHKGIDEVNSCEIEVERLLNDFHTTTVNSSIFEEKALELLMAREMSTVIQREKLYEEINLANADMKELKEKLASIEDENGVLKEELNAYLLLITALSDDIASLEEHTFSLANHHKPNYQEKQEEQMFDHEHGNSTQKPSDNHNEIISTRGLIELKKLRDKVKALEMVVVNSGNLIEQGTFESNSNVDAVMKEIEVLKSEANSRDSKDIDKAKYEQIMKDIQLDRYGNESNDDTSNELISIMSESSERADIDKLQFPKRFSESHQDWNKSAIQRLLSDAQRLSLLQVSVEELKRDMEASKKNRSPKGFEFDTVTAKLRESEGEVSQLIETNSELIKKSEELLSALPDEMRIVSERTGQLEFDLEKIKYVLLKLKEEHENKRGKVFGRRRVLLKDYLYGRMDSRKQKKGRSWRCMRPKTMND